MSPDPPREDSGDDENRIRRFSGDFMEGMINDDEFFIVPDAPYELDMDEESEYSDSDEEGGRGASGAGVSQPGSQNSTRTPQLTVMLESNEQELVFHEGQSRGRYRLLIPFPNATTTATDDTASDIGSSNSEVRSTDDNQDAGGVVRSEVPQDTTGPDEGPSANSSISEESSTDKPSTSGCGETKREIELTDEKVEKIKEVMKNITLPPTSIPKWASEIDEDSWRKKLNDSITSSGRLPNKTDKCVSGETSKD